MKPKIIFWLALVLSGEMFVGCDTKKSKIAGASMAGPSSNTAAYTIKNLGTLDARAINCSGQVVGWGFSASGKVHAFLYGGDKIQDLGTLTGYDLSEANAINAAGEVVGWVGPVPGQPRAFVCRGGRMQEIGALGGSLSEACAINAAGDITGWAQIANGQRHAFLYHDGHMQDLGAFGTHGSSAYGINDLRQIVGASSSVDDMMRIPFLYDSGKMVPLDIPDHQDSRATAINSAGEIVGHVGDVTQQSSDQAFVYSHGIFHDLGNFGGIRPFSIAIAINANGQIVGMCGSCPLDNGFDGEKAFLYSDGHMQDLRGLVGEANLTAAGIKALFVATGINDRGQIVGNGIDFKTNQIAFLLTPIKNSVLDK
jgi:probable HAF family extracellular repeat protein